MPLRGRTLALRISSPGRGLTSFGIKVLQQLLIAPHRLPFFPQLVLVVLRAPPYHHLYERIDRGIQPEEALQHRGQQTRAAAGGGVVVEDRGDFRPPAEAPPCTPG